MSHWQKIRNEASELGRKIRVENGRGESEFVHADLLIEAAVNFLELEYEAVNPHADHLRNSLAVLEEDIIFVRNDLPGWYKTFCIAHEIGHFQIHRTSLHCDEADINQFSVGEENSSTAERSVGYGAGERREREANLFAIELLLPCDMLQNAFLQENKNARQIAVAVGLPVELVAAQLSRALLVPAFANKTAEPHKFDLDPSQKNAAAAKCPTLVSAGPGTGKTQTLTGRISHLIKNGVSPEKILALTFSNKAAEEMRERVAAENAEAAVKIEALTFHAFGLNLLRKYYVEAGLEKDSKLLDKIDALLYLERNLGEINLEHYQTLHEPTTNLPAILVAVSRAKDECCSPSEYKKHGEKMLATADTDEAKTEAEKILETAGIYQFYEDFLTREKMLDFGDLIYKSVALLQQNEAVKREVGSKYAAILVDEFQDVNRACGMLLKEIAGGGENLWAVGDVRQSIYRWRGASPANLHLFEQDFHGAEIIPLETNYRSDENIVRLFSEFAGQMKAAGEDIFYRWEAFQGIGKTARSVNYEIADSLRAEGESIARKIIENTSNGIGFKQQAVICRTHSQLANFAKILSEKEIPIFYLGQIFEREEVRDLLSLLDLKFTSNAHTLIRVAKFSEYQIPFDDTKTVIDEFAAVEKTFEQLLSDETLLAKLSDAGKTGIKKLSAHLFTSAQNISAWKFLTEYLFSESLYLQKFFQTEDVQNQSKRLAIYQFLKLTQTLEERFIADFERQIPEFLNYVKKLAWFNEDKNYAQIPASAENLDAVRLLTVHSAKGLEFDAVFLPHLATRYFPSSKKSNTCPHPSEMIAGDADFHDEEEECLFFVAMSRAKEQLHLSRATSYGKNNSNESKFLTALAEFLPNAIEKSSETGYIAAVLQELSAEQQLETFYSSQLDQYLKCPRSYFYANVLGLKAKGDTNIYLKFHNCIYDTMNSMRAVKDLENIEFTQANALQRLDEFWTEAAIEEHPYSPIYKEKAREIVRTMFAHLEKTKEKSMRPTLELKLSNGSVRLSPDEILKSSDEKTIIINRYKTGKKPKTINHDDKEVLAFAAVQSTFPEAEIAMQKIFLTDDETAEIKISPTLIKNRRERYEEAIHGIKTENFPADPSDKNCPHCPHYFICPS